MDRLRLGFFLFASLLLGVGTGQAQQGDGGEALDPAVRADIRQLKQIARNVTHQDERLAKVLGHIGPPDAPVPTELRAALAKVGLAALAISNRTAPYLGTSTVPPPPPPAPGPATELTRAQRRDLQRLESIARNLAEEDERLARVLGHIGPPDQPIADAVRAAITSVRTASQSIVGHVTPYLGGGTVPPPPSDGPVPPGGGSATPPPPSP